MAPRVIQIRVRIASASNEACCALSTASVAAHCFQTSSVLLIESAYVTGEVLLSQILISVLCCLRSAGVACVPDPVRARGAEVPMLEVNSRPP